MSFSNDAMLYVSMHASSKVSLLHTAFNAAFILLILAAAAINLFIAPTLYVCNFVAAHRPTCGCVAPWLQCGVLRIIENSGKRIC